MLDKIDIKCPECGSKVRFSLADVSARRMVPCGRGHRIKLDETHRGDARKTQKAVDDLEKTIKRLGR